MATNSRRTFRPFVLALGAVLTMFLMTFVVTPEPVDAAVGTGAASSGGGGACPKPPRGGYNGCPFTTNGQGWFELPVDYGDAPKGNGYWNIANSTCKSEGAGNVVAYVVFTGEKTLSKAWIYRYTTGWEKGNPYVGNISMDTAYSRFMALEPSERAGFTYGQNLGWFCSNYSRPFSINAQSYVRKSPSKTYGRATVTALPNDVLEFAHDLRANGEIRKRVYYTLRSENFPDDFRMTGQSWSGPTTMYHSSVAPTIADNSLFVNFNVDTGNGSYMTYRVRQSDVGKTLCQAIEYAPTTDKNDNASSSTKRCADVPYRYTLVPSISGTNITDGNVVETRDDPLPVDATIRNNGPTKSRTNVEWQITQVEYSVPLTSIPNKSGGANQANDPCRYFTGNIRCNPIGSGTIAAGISYPGTFDRTVQASIANKPAGTKICFAMSVRPYNQTGNTWSHSALRCIVIGKKPKVQVLSGDLIIGRTSPSNVGRASNVDTSVSYTDRVYYGSWVEQGIVASGCVSGMASGSGLATGYASNAPQVNLMANISLLTFTSHTSSSCASNLGLYSHATPAPNVAARFPINIRAGTIGSTPDPAVLPGLDVALSDLTGTYQMPAGQTALAVRGGSDIPVGRRVVINAPNATVTINEDIRYTNNPLNKLEDIPQVVIIARNIVIHERVQQIDAWLVATGTEPNGNVNTCGAGNGVTLTSPLTVNVCSAPLTINGPVIANKIQLRRTGGSTPESRGAPAEVFNLRPDSYLWATGYNLSTGRLSTVQSKELPPRY